MTIKELIDSGYFQVVTEGNWGNQRISTPYCCDLLSHAMGKAPEGCAWVTVIGNRNTLAVASLVKASCIILAEGIQPEDGMEEKARELGMPVFKTDQPVFEAALAVSGSGYLSFF